jgi:hypothetical protein
MLFSKSLVLLFVLTLSYGAVAANEYKPQAENNTTSQARVETPILLASSSAPRSAPTQTAASTSAPMEHGVIDSTILAARSALGSIPESISILMIVAGLYLIWASYKQEKAKKS